MSRTMHYQDGGDPQVGKSSQLKLFKQSQFGGVFIGVVLLNFVIARFARYAGSWGWISGYTTEVIECGIWYLLMIPLLFVAYRTRMSNVMRYTFYAMLFFQSADVGLALTVRTEFFADIPLLGPTPRVYDGHNGSLNDIVIALLGTASVICMLSVWFSAMAEADLVRESLALETERLDAEIRERERAESRIQEMTVEIQHSARLNMIGEIAAGVAHELHQPLAAIANYANGCKIRLKNGKLQLDDADDVLDQIAGTAIRAGAIVDRIRSFAQKRTPDVVPTDPNIAVNHAVELAEFNLKKREIDLKLDLAADLPKVPIDAVEVSQVALNLILNAIEAIDSNENSQRTLEIQSRRDTGGGVVISVQDTGPGVAPDTDGQIYDQFFTTKQHGLGMGLAICKSIVDRYEGRLWHESGESGGTVFHFTIPIEQSDPNLKRQAQEKVA